MGNYCVETSFSLGRLESSGMDGDDSNPAVYVYLMPLNYILKNDKFYAMYILPQGNLSSW